MQMSSKHRLRGLRSVHGHQSEHSRQWSVCRQMAGRAVHAIKNHTAHPCVATLPLVLALTLPGALSLALNLTFGVASVAVADRRWRRHRRRQSRHRRSRRSRRSRRCRPSRSPYPGARARRSALRQWPSGCRVAAGGWRGAGRVAGIVAPVAGVELGPAAAIPGVRAADPGGPRTEPELVPPRRQGPRATTNEASGPVKGACKGAHELERACAIAQQNVRVSERRTTWHVETSVSFTNTTMRSSLHFSPATATRLTRASTARRWDKPILLWPHCAQSCARRVNAQLLDAQLDHTSLEMKALRRDADRPPRVSGGRSGTEPHGRYGSCRRPQHGRNTATITYIRPPSIFRPWFIKVQCM